MMNPIIQTKTDIARPVPTHPPYSYIDALSSYNINYQTISLLEQARAILRSGNYYTQTIGFPDTSPVVTNGVVNNFLLGETKSGTMNVPPFSYLISVACFDQNGGGFKIRIFDKGTKAELFDRQYGQDRIIGSNQDLYDTNIGPYFGVDGIAAGLQNPFSNTVGCMVEPPFYLLSPFIITPPGVLQIDMTNMDNGVDGNLCQAVLEFAVPINNQSQQVIIVEEG